MNDPWAWLVVAGSVGCLCKKYWRRCSTACAKESFNAVYADMHDGDKKAAHERELILTRELGTSSAL